MNNKQKILFGAGITGQMALNYFCAENVYCYADNKKYGQIFCGKPVISFDELVAIAPDFDIVITVSENKIQEVTAIAEQLANKKISYKVFRECVDVEKLPSNPDIAYFRDLHKGEKCFVIGNGPSLRSEDLDTLYKHKSKCFGANLINKIFNKTKWRPDYYVAQDPIMMNNMVDAIALTDVQHKFLPNPSDVILNEADKIKKLLDSGIGKAHYYFGVRMSPQKIEFYHDASKILFLGGTVLCGMIQIAAYMGFKDIYLIGADGTNTHVANKDYFAMKRHFYDESKDSVAGLKNTYMLVDPAVAKANDNKALQKLDEHSRARGYRIFNATRGGVLDMFDRVNFDDLFSKED